MEWKAVQLQMTRKKTGKGSMVSLLWLWVRELMSHEGSCYFCPAVFALSHALPLPLPLFGLL